MKDVLGTTTISIDNASIADGDGTISTPDTYNKIFNIVLAVADVNADGIFDLGDIAIISKMLGKTSTDWGSYTPDIDSNGLVTKVDRDLLVTEMMN